jgi:sugar lactone lactonase YvrE
VAPDGTLYVSLRTHVEVFDASGNRRAVWEAPQARAWLSGLLATADTVYAADSGNRVVWRCDRSGRVISRLGEKDPARGIPGLVLPSPHLVVVGHPDGRLRLNNAGRHLVETYTPEGERVSAWGKPGMGIAAFCGCCNPIALAVLPDGRIVTAEKGLPRVKVYQPDGRLDCVVAGVESFPENLRATRGESRNDTLNLSLDVVADPRGRICILDPVSATVRVMVPVERT